MSRIAVLASPRRRRAARRRPARPVQRRRLGGCVAVRPSARAVGVGAARRRRPSTPTSADQADGRARLHPERPVRAVLPRRAGRLLRRGRPRRDVPERDRLPTSSPLVGAGRRSTSASPTGPSVIPAVSQGIPIKYVATIYGKFPSIVFAKASSGIDERGRPQGQEARHPGQVRLVLDHAPGAARLGGPHARRPARSSSTPTSARAPRSPQGAVDAATGLRQQRARPARADRRGGRRCSMSTTSRRCPGTGLIAGDKTLETKRDAIDGVRRGDPARDGGDRRRTRGRARCGDQGRPGPRGARDTQAAILDATIDVVDAGPSRRPMASGRSSRTAGRRRSRT